MLAAGMLCWHAESAGLVDEPCSIATVNQRIMTTDPAANTAQPESSSSEPPVAPRGSAGPLAGFTRKAAEEGQPDAASAQPIDGITAPAAPSPATGPRPIKPVMPPIPNVPPAPAKGDRPSKRRRDKNKEEDAQVDKELAAE